MNYRAINTGSKGLKLGKKGEIGIGLLNYNGSRYRVQLMQEVESFIFREIT